MRVLIIDVNCNEGSTGKIAYDMYSYLKSQKIDASVCYGRGLKIREQNIFKFGINLETYLHAFLTRITGLTGYFSPLSTWRLLRYIRKYKPDVVHIHELHAYFVNIKPIMRYLKINNIKTIWTFHCEFMYTGKCGHAFNCDKWTTECGKCPRLNEYPKTMFFDFTKKMFLDKKELFRNFNNLIIVSPSCWLAKRVSQSFLSGKKIQTIHNGIDTNKVFYPRQFDHLKKKHGLKNEKIILAVAPDIMSTLKGGEHVIKLAEKLKNEHVKVIMIGVADLNVPFPTNVIPLSRTINQHELAEYYSMADVFVICSEKENFPTTCLEALCCGTPIVGFDVGGTAETAPDGLGEFVPFGDICKLKDAVMRRINSSNISSLCEQYGRINYSKNVMAENYLKLYQEN